MQLSHVVDLEPWVLRAIICSYTFLWVLTEHLCNKVLGLCRNRLPVGRIKRQLLLQHVLKDFFVVVSFEGWVAA